MAVMAMTTTGIAPFASGWKEAGVKIKHFSGPGVTITPVHVAVADKRHVIVGGRVSVDKAATFDIVSAATVRDSLEFITRGTANLPKGFETATNEALSFTNVSAAEVLGWVAYVTIEDGQYCPLTEA